MRLGNLCYDYNKMEFLLLVIILIALSIVLLILLSRRSTNIEVSCSESCSESCIRNKLDIQASDGVWFDWQRHLMKYGQSIYL